MEFSASKQATLDETEGEKLLNMKFIQPKERWYDSLQVRMDQLEPMARSIEYLLDLWSRHVDKVLHDNARVYVTARLAAMDLELLNHPMRLNRAIKKYRNDRSKLGITGKFPSLGGSGKTSGHSEEMYKLFGELQRKISDARLVEKTRQESEKELSELLAQRDDLKQRLEATVNQHEVCLAETLGTIQQQYYFGQFVMQQKGLDDQLVATIASPESLRNAPIYIDCSGNRGGKVAQGSFGSIYLGRTRSNDLYAVKLPVSGRLGDNELEREGEIWSELQDPSPHPHILEFFGTCVLGRGMFKGLMSRWVEGGRSWKDSLLDFTEKEHIEFMEKIASAIVHMHQKAIIHGDIKLDNVIITPTPSRPLLCDFGMSVRRTLDSTRDSVKGEGSGPHVSPEIYRHIPKSTGSDIWAFGILIVHALSKKIPFEDHLLNIPGDQVLLEYHRRLVVLGQRPAMPDALTHAGKQAWNVAIACLHNVDTARPRMQDVHEAIQDIISYRDAELNTRLERWKLQAQTAEQTELARRALEGLKDPDKVFD
ncbi:hypothetical protein FRC00_007331 [Tulasnella sp. 408]|nr:hypothetical protein FRC00_007331 [Tulasnella sp. 408]